MHDIQVTLNVLIIHIFEIGLSGLMYFFISLQQCQEKPGSYDEYGGEGSP